MNRKFKHGMSMAVAILSALFVSTACTEEWDDHYDDNGTNASKTSILDVIKSDSELSDFCAVLDSLNIEDKNGKLVVLADSLLNQSRVYTLWAPVNGSFDKEAYLQDLAAVEDPATGKIIKPNRDKVFKRFVLSHMADYVNTASKTMSDDNYVLLLNEKMVPFAGNYTDGYTFDKLTVESTNIRANNGIVHKISGTVNYALNLWEYLETAADADSVAKFLYSFNIMEFNEGLSIEGPTVQGKKTYLDSVFTNSNQWLSVWGDKYSAGFGDVMAEDSSYMMFVPSNEVWDEMVPKIEKMFNFYSKTDADAARNDSLKKFYARKMLLNNIVFSYNDQPALESDGNLNIDENGDGERDSLLSTYKLGSNGPRLFARADLMNGAREGVECSNGTFYIKDNFNFSPFYLWHDTIIVEAENTEWQGQTYASKGDFYLSCNVNTVYVGKNDWNSALDTLEETRNIIYTEGIGVSTYSNPEFLWTIPEVLSGSYYVGAVIVPAHLAYKTADPATSLPNKLNIIVNANTGKGSPQKLAEVKDLNNDPLRLDTVWMTDDNGERMKIKFPYSEFGLDKLNTAVTVKVKGNVGRREEGFDRRLRVDFLILEPVEDDEE